MAGFFKNIARTASRVVAPALSDTVDNLAVDPVEESLEEAGISTDLFDTFTSRPADKINLPEVINAKATFVYNYYTRDERVRVGTKDFKERIVTLDANNTDEIFYQVKNKKLPRYVKLTIKPPKINDALMNTVPLNKLGIDLEESLNLIVTEGATSSQIFTGVEIIDTGRESNIYSMLRGTMFFTDLPLERTSQKEAADKLHSTLREKGALEGSDKKLIVEALSNIASEGYTLAPSDVPADIAAFSDDPIAKQTFSVQFNNLLMSNIISNATIYSDNVFNDEIRSLSNFI